MEVSYLAVDSTLTSYIYCNGLIGIRAQPGTTFPVDFSYSPGYSSVAFGGYIA
jgi:hypothetical protein